MPAGPRARQIAELATTVAKLGSKSRGMTVSAADWNQLVSVLNALLTIDAEQDRDVEGTLSQSYSRTDHAHNGEVSLSWLDADLQARLSTGGSDPISTRQAMASLQKSVSELRSEVAALRERVENQTTRIDLSVTKELERATKLIDFEGRFRGLEGLRATVTGIATSQSTLSKNFDEVLQFRGQLTDAATGALIDVSGLRTEVKKLNDIAAGLKGVDSQRFKELELKLKELQLPTAGGVSGAVLDGRFADFETRLNDRFVNDTTTRLAGLRTELIDADTALSNSLSTQIDQKVTLGSNRSLTAVGTLVADAETRLKGDFTSQITATRTAATEAARQEAKSSVTAQLANFDQRVGAAVDTRVATLEQRLNTSIKQQVGTTVSEGIAPLSQSLDTRLAGMQLKVDALPASITAQIKQGAEAIRVDQQAWLTDQFKQKSNSLDASLGPLIATGVASGLDTRMGTIRSMAAEEVTKQLVSLDGRISSSVEAATLGLTNRIETTVTNKLNQFDVNGRINAESARIVALMRTEISDSAAKVQKDSNLALNSAVKRWEVTRGSGIDVSGAVTQPGGRFFVPGGG
ncbi:hypothetical protein VW23_009455 [Devosia insulae DS-56]|uniref:Uncharacterized protein n=1 Tax=Devosia insulae DS-56 TaxID=1116389 RepID=A0A1E5XW82_9HYPH|nr:hypothetical protein [Devosia insulae]OEO32845.1 hypothetical protein VW23_009455 [Devosia insulae DS-56]